MVFDISFSPAFINLANPEQSTVPLAFAIGCLTLLITLGLFGLVFILRRSLLAKRAHQKRFIESWAPIWGQCFQGELPERIPLLSLDDMTTFLTQWIQYQETADESMRETLCMVALKAGVEKHLHQILRRRSIREKILAITALGFLKDHTYDGIFRHWINFSNISLSLASARALLQLDPQGSIPLLIKLLREREDWPQARMILFLTEAGIHVVSEPLSKAVLETPTPRMIHYLSIAYASVAVPAITTVLRQTSDSALILACLQTLSKFDVRDELPLLRRFLKHPDWECRAAAAKLIGKSGNSQDEAPLLALLSDSQNIVQYEAALALFDMPHFDREYASQICEQLTEQNGLRVLTRVMTEKRWQP